MILSSLNLVRKIGVCVTSEENGESKLTSEENLLYTIRDQSAIFQLTILSSLAGAREYIMYCSLKNQALSSLIV
jgi:hypothetical protein